MFTSTYAFEISRGFLQIWSRDLFRLSSLYLYNDGNASPESRITPHKSDGQQVADEYGDMNHLSRNNSVGKAHEAILFLIIERNSGKDPNG